MVTSGRHGVGSAATINQVTQSYQDPNVTFDPGGRVMQLVFRVTWNRATERAVRAILDALAKVPPIGLEWEPLKGPYFGNQIGTLQLRGRHAEVSLEQAGIEDDVPSLTGKQAQLSLS